MTSYGFKKRPGTDLSDPEFVLQHRGKPTRVQIQDSSSWGGAYAVSVDYLDDEAEPHLLWVARPSQALLRQRVWLSAISRRTF